MNNTIELKMLKRLFETFIQDTNQYALLNENKRFNDISQKEREIEKPLVDELIESNF